MTREELLSFFWQNADSYISGEELAGRLQVSRAAVWKAVGQLRAEGYAIESVPGRGYRLLSASDVLSEEGIRLRSLLASRPPGVAAWGGASIPRPVPACT